MASLSKEGSGWRILYVCPETGKRKTIRTGECAKKKAETAKNMIEHIVESKSLGTPLDQQTVSWLMSISETPLRGRLAKAGLVEEVKIPTLATFMAEYIEGRKDVKPASKTVWRQAEASLNKYFGEDRKVNRIIRGEAEAFKRSLIASGMAPYTVRKRLQVARMFFNSMVHQGMISESPFTGVKVAAVVDESRNQYVSREIVTAVMEEAPDAEWRAMIALSRFGGLRLPSEVLSLKWDHIDWGREQIIVPSPKTAHHPGKGQRLIPLFPEFLEASEQAPHGAVHVVTRHRLQADSPEGWRNCNLRTRFEKMVRRAGFEP